MKRIRRWRCEVMAGANTGTVYIVHGSSKEATALAERELRGSLFVMKRAGFWDPSRCDIVDEDVHG